MRVRALCARLVGMVALLAWTASVAHATPPSLAGTSALPIQATSNQAVTVGVGEGVEDLTQRDENAAAEQRLPSEDATAPSGMMIRRSARKPKPIAVTDQTLRSKWSGTSYTALFPLVIVLVVVGAVAWGAKRWVPSVRSQESGFLCVEARASLSPKHSLALVRLGRRFVLVGCAGDRMVRLADISDPEEAGHLAELVGLHGKVRDPEFENLLTMAESEFTQEVAPLPEVRTERPRREAGTPSLNKLLGRLRSLQPKGR